MGKSLRFAQVEPKVLRECKEPPQFCQPLLLPEKRNSKIDGNYNKVGRYDPEKTFEKKSCKGNAPAQLYLRKQLRRNKKAAEAKEKINTCPPKTCYIL